MSYKLPLRNQKRKASSIACIQFPTHLFGLPPNVDRVRDIVNDPTVAVVEDAAQALGLSWNGKKLGTIGVMKIEPILIDFLARPLTGTYKLVTPKFLKTETSPSIGYLS
jgi:hypothetical protein